MLYSMHVHVDIPFIMCASFVLVCARCRCLRSARTLVQGVTTERVCNMMYHYSG